MWNLGYILSTKSEWRKCEITKDIISQAKKYKNNVGTFKGSFTNGERAINGFIGEILLNNILNGKMVRNFDYDILKDGYKIDVKTKTISQSEPHENMEVSVSSLKQDQDIDLFAFVFIKTDLSTGWILGYLHKRVFNKIARRRMKGDIVCPGVIAKNNDLVITVKQLNKFN